MYSLYEKKIFLLSQNMQQHKIKRGKQKLTVHGSLFLNVVQKVMCVKLTIFAVIIWRNSLKSIVPKENEKDHFSMASGRACSA